MGFKNLIIQFGSFILVFVVVVAVKYGKSVFATSTAIHTQNMMHMGWNDAHKELRESFEKSLVGVDVSDDVKNKYLDCLVEKAVNYLNQTVCSYHYNKMTTSAEDHIKQQDECVKTSGYLSALDMFFKECADKAVGQP